MVTVRWAVVWSQGKMKCRWCGCLSFRSTETERFGLYSRGALSHHTVSDKLLATLFDAVISKLRRHWLAELFNDRWRLTEQRMIAAFKVATTPIPFVISLSTLTQSVPRQEGDEMPHAVWLCGWIGGSLRSTVGWPEGSNECRVGVWPSKRLDYSLSIGELFALTLDASNPTGMMQSLFGWFNNW